MTARLMTFREFLLEEFQEFLNEEGRNVQFVNEEQPREQSKPRLVAEGGRRVER